MGMTEDPTNIVPFPNAPASVQGAAAAASPPPAPPSSPTAASGPSDDPSDAFATKKGLPEYYYEEASGEFCLKNAAGEWVGLDIGGLRRHLKKQHSLRDKPLPGTITSELDDFISDVEKNRRVAFAGVLAGWKEGVHTITGQRILVSRSPEIIEPKQGEWPKLREFFTNLFVGTEEGYREDEKPSTLDQTDYFFAWHRDAMECYMRGKIASGLALCVAGEADCGKSRLAMILKWCFGGQVAKPYDFMIGRDNFNRDLFAAVLQLVDDENADTSINARLKFAAQIKKIVANDDSKQRAMHKDGLNLSVLWRLVALVNLEANRLMVMPPIDGDIKDKILMLKGYKKPKPTHAIDLDTPAELACWPMPMPTRTIEEQERFRATLRAELPAYLWWLLNEYKMPSHVVGGRFRVKAWQHPQILENLQQFSPHVRLWQLIVASRAVFEDYMPGDKDRPAEYVPRQEWKGKVADLHALLVGEKSKLSAHDRKSVPEPAWLGQRLMSCKEHFGADVCDQKRTSSSRIWVLRNKEGVIE